MMKSITQRIADLFRNDLKFEAFGEMDEREPQIPYSLKHFTPKYSVKLYFGVESLRSRLWCGEHVVKQAAPLMSCADSSATVLLALAAVSRYFEAACACYYKAGAGPMIPKRFVVLALLLLGGCLFHRHPTSSVTIQQQSNQSKDYNVAFPDTACAVFFAVPGKEADR